MFCENDMQKGSWRGVAGNESVPVRCGKWLLSVLVAK